MKSRILQWGILSTARINQALIKPLAESPRNHLMAVASRDEARVRDYASQNGIERAYGSYDALLADPEIDVVYISMPNSLHAEWAIRAADAGKHVLCEKPLAMSVEEVDAISAAAARNSIVVAEAFMYRHHPQTLKVQELIASGAIGELRLVRGGFTFHNKRPNNVRLDPELGGGSIWDLGCYPISYARTVMGGAAPEEVMGWQIVGPTGVDISFFGQMRFAGGVYAQFDSSFQSFPASPMEFVGSEGRITLTQSFKPEPNARLYFHRTDQPVEVLKMGDDLTYLGEVEDLYDAAVAGTPQRIPLSDSRLNVLTISALLRSAREGRPVRPA